MNVAKEKKLVTIERGRLINLYRVMVRIRTFEERLMRGFASGRIPGWIHLYSGQEAIAAGVCAHLSPDDYVTSTHRANGHAVAKGLNTFKLMAEIYGRKSGFNKGKAGSMQFVDMTMGFLGANGIVGAGITIAGGAALSARMRGTDQVVVCFFSDGAVNTTRFHEGINLASVWNLPVIYIIENNMLAESTHIFETCKLANLADRAVAYGLPGKTIDGNDVLTVYETAGEAIARARKGEGPSLIECKTCRQRGMFEGDAQTYRNKEEIEECLKGDPIPRFREWLIKQGILTVQESDRIYQKAREEMDKAAEFAEASTLPEPEECLKGVYPAG